MKQFALPILSILLLSGCSVKSDTWINQAGRVEIHEDDFSDTFQTDKLNEPIMHAIGDYYSRYGNGTLHFVVSYDSHSRINSQSRAQFQVARIREGLMRNGITDISAGTSDARGSGEISSTLVTFPAVVAQKPMGCGTMPGYLDPSEDSPDNATAKAHPYGYGCTIESILARQVTRPTDLLGRKGFDTNADGKRAERVLSTRGYYGDTENQPLGGEKASSK